MHSENIYQMLLVDFWSQIFWHNSVKQWCISIAILLLSVLFARLVYAFFGSVARTFTKKTETDLDDILVDRLETPTVLLIVLLGFRYAFELLHFSDSVHSFISRAFVLAIAFNVTWFAVRIADSLIEHWLKEYGKERENIDAQMILLIKRSMRIIFWLVGITLGLNNAGFDVGALIAGLGIGGLALALAAQDTVKNIFGGVMMFLDRPFRIGDTIVIDKVEGTVEYIGIRSTRIRLQSGRLVTLPNAQFTDRAIENISVEPSRRVSIVLGLTYDTPVEKIDLAMEILKQIIADTPHVSKGNYLVFFEKLNTFSLDIKMIYHIEKSGNIIEVPSTVNREILKRFNEAKLEFAFPTQTSYSK